MSRGFTLIEMSVVLLVIAIVTHLALRQLGGIRDEKLRKAADRQLEEIRTSVFGLDREGDPAGFLADTGRLPLATNGTLAELWQKPAGLRDYAALPATKANLVKGVPADLAQDNIVVGTGWRGPYLRLPVGKTRLFDPWGNAMENPDAAGYERIGTRNGFAVSVSHFGPTALSRDRRTLSLLPDGPATNSLTLTAYSRTATDYSAIRYKWFGPCNGLITGDVKSVSFALPHTFYGLTPGNRVIWYSAVSGDRTNACSRVVAIRPGANLVEVALP